MVLNAYTFPIIYNIPLMHHDFRNWQSTIYHYCVKPLFTSNKKDDFHKRLHQFTKNKELFKTMSENSLKIFDEKFNYVKIKDKTLDEFK